LRLSCHSTTGHKFLSSKPKRQLSKFFFIMHEDHFKDFLEPLVGDTRNLTPVT